MDELLCSLCDTTLQGIENFKLHMGIYHGIKSQSNVSLKCRTKECGATFSRPYRLYTHLSKYHCSSDSNYKIENPLGVLNVRSEPHTTKSIPFNCLITKMIADARQSTTLTGADLGRIVTLSENLLTSVMQEVHSRVDEFLTSQNIDKTTDCTKNFLDQFIFDSSFSKYYNMRGQLNALKENYDYVESRSVSIGYRETKLKDPTAEFVVPGSESVEIESISIIDILKLVLSNKEVFEYLKNYRMPERTDYLCSFEDGESYQTNEFLKRHPDAMALSLYYDEFLVNNPLGSKTHDQKIGAFYISLLKLPLHLREYINNVHVIALGKVADIQEFGTNQCLKSFVAQMKLLESEEGWKVKINDENFILRAVLLNLDADTLAAHDVLGFVSPSGNYFCRTCLISKNERRNNLLNYPAPLRNKSMHQEHLSLLDPFDKAKNDKGTLLTGVKHNSILNELKYFHCTENFSFDAMHDLLEGQANWVLKLVFSKWLENENNGFNVEIINERISDFDYGEIERKNKPSSTLRKDDLKNSSQDHKLQERAAQTWCLLRVTPFLVSDLVPSNDIYLKYLLQQNQILEIVFAPVIHRSILPALEDLIDNYYRLFRQIFPGETPINKLHHMTHYALCMLKSGPLKYRATFKYEAKHQIFKKYGAVCLNFKNILKSMMNVSLMTECATWGSRKDCVRQKIQITVCEDFDEDDEMETTNLEIIQRQFPTNQIKILPHIQIFGTEYKKGYFVALDNGFCSKENMPVFGKIKSIYLCKDEVYFFCQVFKTNSFVVSLNAYRISVTAEHKLVNSEELCDPKPLCKWTDYTTEDDYICLKYLLQ